MWRPSRLRLQFSLRTTLVLFCFVSCVLAYAANIKSRQNAVRAIVVGLGDDILNVDLSTGEVKSPRIEWLPSCIYLFLPETYNYVYLTSPELDDEKLRRILDLPGIEGLSITRGSITDNGLLMLGAKNGLKKIQLYDIPTVSEEAIMQLKATSSSMIQSRSIQKQH